MANEEAECNAQILAKKQELGRERANYQRQFSE
jgi:hypothetical protein